MRAQLRRNFFAVALFFILAWGYLPAVLAQNKSVMVIAATSELVTETQLGLIRDGIRDALKANSFQESKNFKFQFETVAGGIESLDATLLKQSRSRPDVIVVMSAESLAIELTIPAQSTVVQIRLVDSTLVNQGSGWSVSNTQVTGVSNVLSLSKRVALIRQLVPGARKVGVIYNPANAQSAARAKELQEQLTSSGMVMIEAVAQRPVDVGSAARSLISRVDVFYSLDDSNAQQSYLALVKVANDAKIPLFGHSAENVRQGAMAALMVTERDLGTQAGRMIAKILRGTKSTSIPPEFSIRPQLFVNVSAAQKQGVVLTEATLKSAVEVFSHVSQETSYHDRSRR